MLINVIANRRKKLSGILILLLLAGCAWPTGLEPVSAVEGEIIVPESLFADGQVTAITLIVLDKLDLENLGEHFITYSDPILPCVTPCDTVRTFFIQLQPGSYPIIPIGLLVPVATVATSLDSLLALPQLPIRVPSSNTIELLQHIRSVVVKEGAVTTLSGNWRIELEAD